MLGNNALDDDCQHGRIDAARPLALFKWREAFARSRNAFAIEYRHNERIMLF